jgi:anti-sigma regulatory factor (Ser/Thr protein kinase)
MQQVGVDVSAGKEIGSSPLVEREIRVAAPTLGPALDALEAALRGERVPEATVLDLRLAAEEVLTNFTKYGHDDAADHWVRVRLTLLHDEVTLEFTDDGRPFDPLAARPPRLAAPGGERPIGGFGIHLMLAIVDAAEYTRIGAENVLTLRKRLSAPDGDVT